MEQKICIDSDVLINLLRKNEEELRYFEEHSSTRFCMTSINLFEIKCGYDKELEKVIETIDFDSECALIGAGIYKKLASKGDLIGFRDIFIAACCIRHGYPLLTRNVRHFSRIKGLKVIDIDKV